MSGDLAPGMQVGRYQLLFRLGKGGMGEVWAARQSSVAALGFRKVVALKVLFSKETTSNTALMFLDEAKAASSLQHPAIVPTVDLGRDGDLLFIAMDLVQGPSLTSLLQRLVINHGQMPPALVAYLGLRLAGALDYAHTRGQYKGQPLKLVHRDVSPHNVLLDVHSGEVRLTDFGVARTSIQDHQSRVGTVRGKPSYMAPEQVVGGAIDHRTDVFALGIVLYESACLKRLFGRQTAIKSMDAVIKHTPKPLADLVPDFPPSLWQVIRRALHKEPAKRWTSAGEMQEALSNAIRPLEGSSSPNHGLIQLIDANFDRGTFDLDERLRQIEAQGGLPEEPTQAAEAILPTPFWPSEDAEDPLSPEAIEAARTRFAPPPSASPSSSSRPALMPPPNIDFTHIAASQPSAASLSASLSLRSKKTTGPAILLAAAAVMLFGVVGWLALRSPRPPARTPIPPSAPPVPVAHAQPILAPAVGSTAANPTPTIPTDQVVEAAPPPATKPIRRRPARRTERRPRRRKSREAEAERVSYEAVHRLLLRVKALDDVKGTAMIVTLAEAGRDNPEALARLQKQARAFLRSRGRTR